MMARKAAMRPAPVVGLPCPAPPLPSAETPPAPKICFSVFLAAEKGELNAPDTGVAPADAGPAAAEPEGSGASSASDALAACDVGVAAGLEAALPPAARAAAAAPPPPPPPPPPLDMLQLLSQLPGAPSPLRALCAPAPGLSIGSTSSAARLAPGVASLSLPSSPATCALIVGHCAASPGPGAHAASSRTVASGAAPSMAARPRGVGGAGAPGAWGAWGGEMRRRGGSARAAARTGGSVRRPGRHKPPQSNFNPESARARRAPGPPAAAGCRPRSADGPRATLGTRGAGGGAPIPTWAEFQVVHKPLKPACGGRGRGGRTTWARACDGLRVLKARLAGSKRLESRA
jgi:hypothetical protein